MTTEIFKRLFIFEMANNHMGDVNHGLKIIRETAEAAKNFSFQFALKFQYRDLDTFIHPAYKDRMDIKYIKRFSETKLTEDQFLLMKKEIEKYGLLTICTPFDEISVDRVVKHNFSILKVASCSFTDWPLLEKIAATDKPLILSTAGASLNEIDNVVAFLQHRNKNFCLMHCVGSYPTPDNQLELNQIDFFKQRYPEINIGFSTHEEPDNLDSIKIAVAKGAQVFERHVGVKTSKYDINKYSSTPEQVNSWLASAEKAYTICGVEGRRRDISEKEASDLQGLKRGAFAKKNICAEEYISEDSIFLAIPNQEGQIVANDLSKYKEMQLKNNIDSNSPIIAKDLKISNKREKIVPIVNKLCEIIKKSNIALKNRLDLQISHHYGLDNFYKWGCSIINCINREYCKKIIILLPGQTNPIHHHKKKEETFHILYGDVILDIDGKTKKYTPGDIVIVNRNAKHSFSSETGAVFEEVSTTHYINDSYYDDNNIMKNNKRKTYLTFWADWLSKPIF